VCQGPAWRLQTLISDVLRVTKVLTVLLKKVKPNKWLKRDWDISANGSTSTTDAVRAFSR